MVEGPAVGKAGDCLDWIAGGLEKEITEHHKMEKWSNKVGCGWVLWVWWVCVGDG